MTSIDQAARIMGRNFFSLEEARAWFRLDPTSELVPDVYHTIPYEAHTLAAHASNYVLMPVLPISVATLLVQNIGNWRPYTHCVEPLESRPASCGWVLLKRHPHSRALGLSYGMQSLGLHEKDVVADASTVLQAFALDSTGVIMQNGHNFLTSTTEYRSGRRRSITVFRVADDSLQLASWPDKRLPHDSGLALMLQPETVLVTSPDYL